MLNNPSMIPCYDQPERCFIRSPDGIYISSRADGSVVACDGERKAPGLDEMWIPCDIGSGYMVFQSLAHGRYLTLGKPTDDENSLFLSDDGYLNGTVSTGSNVERCTAWAIRPSGTGNDGCVMIQCSMGQLVIDDGIKCRHAPKDAMNGFEWVLEVLSGELCFLNSPKHDLRLSCKPFGKVVASKNWKGWEVFRFIEAGGTDGEVYINGWTHSDRFLKVDDHGSIVTTRDRYEQGTKWTIYRNTFLTASDKDDEGMLLTLSDGSSIYCNSSDGPTKDGNLQPTQGLVLQSSHSGGLLCLRDGVLRCWQMEEIQDRNDACWHLEAAHRQRFHISAVADGLKKPKHITNSAKRHVAWKADVKTPFISNAQNPSAQWEVLPSGKFVLFRNCETGKYLGALQGGEVLAVSSPGESEHWLRVMSPDNNMMLIHRLTERPLGWSASRNELELEAPTASGKGIVEIESETTLWTLKAAMPPTISGKQIISLGVAGGAAALAIVAAPLAVTSVVGFMGFGAEGVVGGSMAAGMMSAEAIANGGAVAAGGTVATLQSIGAVGLGAAGTTAAMGGGALVGGSVVGMTAAKGKWQTRELQRAAGNETDAATKQSKNCNRPLALWKTWGHGAE